MSVIPINVEDQEIDMANCPHTSFRQGKRIIILFKDGTRLIDKYLGNKSGYLIMKENGRIKLSEVRQTGIYKRG